MRSLLTIAASAAILAAAPALAKPGNGNGHGNGGGNGHGNSPAWSGPMSSSHSDNYRAPVYRTAAPGCPPGLAKKNNGCMPPGQAKRLWSRGQRVPSGYQYWTPYSNIPRNYIDQYGLRPDDRYIYRDGYIYQVDPRTRVVEQILSALVR